MVADAPASNIRTLVRNDRTQPDSAAVAHIVVGTGFLSVGAVAAAATLVSLSFPSFVPLGYGVLRAVTMLALVVGFATVSVAGGTYYVLPRLTGARLSSERLAWAGLVLLAGTAAIGIIAVAVGLGDGGEPFALPWWLDLPLLGGLAVPPVVALATLRNRTEHRTYVTIPYVVTGLTALPLVHAVGNIPGTNAVSSALGDAFSTSAYLILVCLVALGLIHYAAVKHGGGALAGRQLAQVGYWSLLFGAGWFGVAQLTSGPTPDWLGVIAAVLGLGFPVGVAAVLATLTSTLEGSWRDSEGVSPMVMTSVAGALLALVIAVLASMAGFRATATLVAFTPFWEAIVFGLVLGVFPLLIGAWVFHALPRMTGRRLFSRQLARRTVRLIVIGTGGTVLFLAASGLVTGYSWAGGSFTGAFAAVGEGWAEAAGPGATFLGLASATGLIAAFGNLSLVSLLARTMTRGAATTQEVLVAVEEES